MGLPQLAEQVRSAGRKGDSILAHISPAEARLLKSRGGKGDLNPATGLPEFYIDPDTGEEIPDSTTAEGNAGEKQAQQYQQENPAPQDTIANTPETVPAVDTTAPVNANPVVDPAQQQAAELSKGLGTTPMPTANAGMPIDQQYAQYGAGRMAGQANGAVQANQVNAVPNVAPSGAQKVGQGISDFIKPITTGITDLSKGLGITPAGLARGAVLGAGAIQANQNSKAMQDTANANEAAIKNLATPYQKMGQELVTAGQQGGLTGPQQQQLQAVKAQMSQQAAQSGQTGGAGQQQIDATIARMSQQFAADNINQGMKLMQIGDKYIQDAISTGYLQNKDAMSLSADFYRYLANAIPGLAVEIDPATGQPKVKP